MDLPVMNLSERWTVRYRLPDGRATDALGWIDRLTDDAVFVTDHHGTRIAIPRIDIVAARRAPAAPGGPGPSRTTAEQLEQIALPGWLADSEPLGEWTLRSGGGFTGRANSCLAVGDPGQTWAAAADAIQHYADAHAIPPRAQVVAGSLPEAELRALGWTDTYVPTDVLAARLAEVLGRTTPDPRVVLEERLSTEWLAAYAVSRPNDADPAVLNQILGGHPPRALASVRNGQVVLAIGRGHVNADWLGLSSIWTDPGHRSRGLATAAIRALGHWAARLGARNVYLQVAAENEGAHRAYARLGFTPHHTYRYLAPSS